MKPFSLLSPIALSIAIAACSSGPPPEKYVLMPTTLSAPKHSGVIGLSEVKLPAYARNDQITTAVTATSLVEEDDHRWAQPPEEAVTSVLERAIEAASGIATLQRPWPRGVETSQTVEISFDRLLRNSIGGAEMSGRYTVVETGGNYTTKRFQYAIPANSEAYADYMNAVSEGLDRLATDIAQDITALAGS